MEGNFSERVQEVIRLSREEALRLGHDYIGTEHLLLGVLRENHGVAIKILLNLGVELANLKKTIEDTVKMHEELPFLLFKSSFQVIYYN